MTFMIDMHSGIVRTIERQERDEVASLWAALMQDEADNFESDTRWQDRALVNSMMRAQVVA